MGLRQTYHALGIASRAYGASGLLIAALLVCSFESSFAQPQTIEGANFKAAPEFFEPPYEKQMKSLVEGARWRHEGAQTVVYEAKVQRFRTNGTVELIVQAPECFYDDNRKVLNSSGPVQFRTADGRFLLSGVGFMYLQTNSTLYVSNQVQTVVLASELNEAKSAAASTNSAAPTKGVTVLSDRFQYSRETGIGIYSGNVHAVGTNVNFKAKSDVMEVFVPEREHQLQTITMSQKVALDYESVEATGDKAVYTAATGIANITGAPAWHDVDGREGRADELTIDRTNKTFLANGQAWVKMPAQNMAGPNALFSSSTNSAQGTNQFVEIYSEHYEFQTNGLGKLVQFGDHVLMVDTVSGQTNGTLTAGTVLFTLVSTNELQTMVAEKNVVIQNNNNQFTGQKAVYTATNSILELTGNPTWRADTRNGKGDLILVDLKQSKMDVLTNAYMRVPASELGPSALAQGTREEPSTKAIDSGKAEAPAVLSTKEKVEGNFSPLPPVPEERPRKAPRSTLGARPASSPEFAEIFSERYTVTTNAARSEAHFQGGVRIVHPRLNWVCQTMNVDSPNSTNKNVTMIAEKAVGFDLKGDEEESPNVHGTCDRAVYNYAVTSSGTNDTMTLTGNPILESTNGVFKNKIIVLDCARNKLLARGPYRIYGTNLAVIPTNALHIPSTKKRK